jgi:hypothetical protein
MQFNHLDFQGRVLVDEIQITAQHHASHVTGTMISSEVNSDQRKEEESPEAYAYVSNWTNDLVEMATGNNNGLLLSNHSCKRLHLILRSRVYFRRITGRIVEGYR